MGKGRQSEGVKLILRVRCRLLRDQPCSLYICKVLVRYVYLFRRYGAITAPFAAPLPDPMMYQAPLIVLHHLGLLASHAQATHRKISSVEGIDEISYVLGEQYLSLP